MDSIEYAITQFELNVQGQGTSPELCVCAYFVKPFYSLFKTRPKFVVYRIINLVLGLKDVKMLVTIYVLAETR